MLRTRFGQISTPKKVKASIPLQREMAENAFRQVIDRLTSEDHHDFSTIMKGTIGIAKKYPAFIPDMLEILKQDRFSDLEASVSFQLYDLLEDNQGPEYVIDHLDR